MRSKSVVSALISASLISMFLAACGPKKVDTKPEPEEEVLDPMARYADKDDGLEIEGLYAGYVDEEDIASLMRGSYYKAKGCFKDGESRNPLLQGSVNVGVTLKSDGSAEAIFIEETDLGDLAAERCILELVRSLDFPTPDGGGVKMTLPFTWRTDKSVPGLEARPASGVVGEVETLREQITENCEGAPMDGYVVTLYVDREGKALSAGMLLPAETEGTFADCVVDQIMAAAFTPAAAVAAKITFPID